MPFDADYGLDDSDDTPAHIHTRELPISTSNDQAISPELIDLLLDREAEEARLRRLGRTEERVGSIIGRRYGPSLAKLAARGVDISSTTRPSAHTKWAQRVHADNLVNGEKDARSRAFKDD